MGACQAKESAVPVRVDGKCDYVDHATRKVISTTLDQAAVHSGDVLLMKPSMRKSPRTRILRHLLPQVFHEESSAGFIVESARQMSRELSGEKDTIHRNWQGPSSGHSALLDLLGVEESQVSDRLISLASDVREIVRHEATLQEVSVPLRIFGAIHGQFRDLLYWFRDFGWPSHSGPAYIFNGDWVDRGAHQVETVTLIFALKIVFPHKVFLNRGNHEFRSQNYHMGKAGFFVACSKLSTQSCDVFEAFHKAFEVLPLACLVARKILVVHGGVGDGDWDLQDLADEKRPITDRDAAESNLVSHVLWSDPLPEIDEDSSRVADRGMARTSGKDVIEEFCQRIGLAMIVRSNQVKRNGCGYEVMHGGRVMRVFSARDHEGHGNDGAMLKVRLSRGGKLVIRAKVLRSVTKMRQDSSSERNDSSNDGTPLVSADDSL
eukprot:TRINITY_DN38612_c0_g1_i1.p1 TRINITY_DN38612_c0_g1~~TRINITY_DN38612_c0_g1_i1.p1  ORF type:complete len:434 (+),score=71.64 TRINITY_DN38612_c0_g1_i1:101-1402(+)